MAFSPQVDAAANDPLLAQQWGIFAIGADRVWAVTTGKGVTVAVVDSGSGPHPDLADNLLPGRSYFSSVETQDGNDIDTSGHGSHVAGIIAAAANNGIGGSGVAPNAKILPIKVLDQVGQGDARDVAAGVRFAADNGAKVINGSFGKDYSPHKEWVWEAMKYAESKDVLIVLAAGNDGKNVDVEPNYPEDTPDKKTELVNNVIKVGAINYNYGEGVVADFSNYGATNVDVFAPGVKIYATIPNGKYKFEQGTSMASPNVAGVAALIRSYYPNLKANQVKQIIMQSGVTLAFDVKVGEEALKIPFSQTCISGKIVNAYNALKMAEELSSQLKKEPKL